MLWQSRRIVLAMRLFYPPTQKGPAACVPLGTLLL